MNSRLLNVTLATGLSLGIAAAGSAQTAAVSAPASSAEPANAATHVASGPALDRLVASEVAQQELDRQAIRDLLQREDVREVARQAGLDIRKAEAAVATLDGRELRDTAQRAREAQEQLAGGSSSITITTTTLIIILLVVILLIVALK